MQTDPHALTDECRRACTAPHEICPLNLLANTVSKKRLQKVGAQIARMRRRHAMNQARLGAKLWPNISPTAAQTRICRAEKGEYELSIEDTHRLFDLLQITNLDAKTLLPVSTQADRRGILLDAAALEIFPDLPPYFELINNNLQRGNKRQALLHMKGLCNYLCNSLALAEAEAEAEAEEGLQVNGDSPFSRGAPGKE